ncbi:hypothetical protein BJ875DRAFT_347207, partial [Amylocarpus encephaloides]
LPFKTQHWILNKTQQLLEECCYRFMGKWFPSVLEDNGWDVPEAVELTVWWKTLSNCVIPTAAVDLSQGQSLADLFNNVKYIRHSAVHRDLQMPIQVVEEMTRDAWLLSSALRDDSTTAQLQHWHKELELWEICRARTELETRLAELESRGNKLTQSLEEDKTCPLFNVD